LGWDERAVKEAAKDHGSKEARARQAMESVWEEQRTLKHDRYLASAKTMVPSPVGQYIVDCEKIERGYEVKDLTLAIRATRTSGLYQASFDFGVIEGIMMLSADESMLAPYTEQYGDDSDIEDDYDEDEDEDEEEDESAGAVVAEAWTWDADYLGRLCWVRVPRIINEVLVHDPVWMA
jgi:hypothetical protein